MKRGGLNEAHVSLVPDWRRETKFGSVKEWIEATQQTCKESEAPTLLQMRGTQYSQINHEPKQSEDHFTEFFLCGLLLLQQKKQAVEALRVCLSPVHGGSVDRSKLDWSLGAVSRRRT